MFLLFIYKNYLYIKLFIHYINNNSHHFEGIHYMPGTLLRTLFFKILFSEGGYINHIPISHIRQVRPREVKLIAQHHTAGKWRGQCSNLCVSDTKVHALNSCPVLTICHILCK